MHLQSWIPVPEASDFTIWNIPFGIFKAGDRTARIGTRIGNTVIDLWELNDFFSLHVPGLNPETLRKETLNDFIRQGKKVTSLVRTAIQQLFSDPDAALKNDTFLQKKILLPASTVKMLLPLQIGDYTDFYSSKYHASNVGSMFRDPQHPLLPNWLHLPVAYHGRSSSIVVSDHPVLRPQGQIKPAADVPPYHGPTQALDFELEMAFVIGSDSTLGTSIGTEEAEAYIFGFVLFNDWSARDMQHWEYVPLGPFLSKNFLSSVSPWIVTIEALEPFRVKGPEPETELLAYLKTSGARNFDIHLEAFIKPSGGAEERITLTNFKYMYWNCSQQLAHHTVNGCNVRVGDLVASGTISGPDKISRGCMLELTWRGQEPLKLSNGAERKYLEDGDTLILRGYAEKEGIRVGFGEVSGKITGAADK
jgi:fumarylacetoacetase